MSQAPALEAPNPTAASREESCDDATAAPGSVHPLVATVAVVLGWIAFSMLLAVPAFPFQNNRDEM